MFGTHAFDYPLEYKTLILNKVAEGDADILRLAVIHHYIKKGALSIFLNFGWKHLYNLFTSDENKKKYIFNNCHEISDPLISKNISLIHF